MKNIIILALDHMSLRQAKWFVRKFRDRVFAFKVQDLWICIGPSLVRKLKSWGAPRVMVDAKIHVSPEQAGVIACHVKNQGADMLTMFASGGLAMMREVVRRGPLKNFAITVPTWISDISDPSVSDSVPKIYGGRSFEKVLQFALLAEEAGAQGLVSSCQDVHALAHDERLQGMVRMVTGVRSRGSKGDDQARVGPPRLAIENGAELVVIGREVTRAKDPESAFGEIEKEIIRAIAENEEQRLAEEVRE